MTLSKQMDVTGKYDATGPISKTIALLAQPHILAMGAVIAFHAAAKLFGGSHLDTTMAAGTGFFVALSGVAAEGLKDLRFCSLPPGVRKRLRIEKDASPENKISRPGEIVRPKEAFGNPEKGVPVLKGSVGVMLMGTGVALAVDGGASSGSYLVACLASTIVPIASYYASITRIKNKILQGKWHYVTRRDVKKETSRASGYSYPACKF